jgi:hypothetical protein
MIVQRFISSVSRVSKLGMLSATKLNLSSKYILAGLELLLLSFVFKVISASLSTYNSNMSDALLDILIVMSYIVLQMS